MIYGVGIDIENHRRFEKFINSKGEIEDGLLSVFTDREIHNYRKYASHLCYALSFSCKEAFFKCFGQDWGEDCMWGDFELFFDDEPGKKRARVKFSGKARELMLKNNIDMQAFFDYHIFENSLIFESYLTCKER